MGVFLVTSVILSLISFSSTFPFTGGPATWDHTSKCTLTMPPEKLWNFLQFPNIVQFLVSPLVANYTHSHESANLVLPNGHSLTLRLRQTHSELNSISMELVNVKEGSISDDYAADKVRIYAQAIPHVDKEDYSVLSTAFKASDASGNEVHGKKILAGLFEDIHDSLRSKYGAYPCSESFRTYGGTCNNVQNANWASYHTPLRRMKIRQDPSFKRGTNEPISLPNARRVSLALCQQKVSNPSKRGVTMLAVFWGQFVDHDLALTPESGHSIFEEKMDIEIKDREDPLYKRHSGKLRFTRSRGMLKGGARTMLEVFPRQQVNSVTGYIDGSQVYGCPKARVYGLRKKKHGEMVMSKDGTRMLPKNSVEELGIKLENAGSNSSSFFVGGDVRVNEQPVLTALHTLFVREHNRIAKRLRRKFKCWRDEKVYQYSRALVSAQLQYITFNFFVPSIIGNKHGLPPYTGYKPDVDASIGNFFATAAFRFGHSMVTDALKVLEKKGKPHARDGVTLHEVFFDPEFVKEVGINALLLGSSYQVAETADTQVVNSLQNELFKRLTKGIDLVALNIQRGRDHGIPLYNDARAGFGLTRKSTFAQVTSDKVLQAKLKKVYRRVDAIDAFIGGLAEDEVEDSELGELFTTAVQEQFLRLRDGDRLFYQNVQWPAELETTKEVKELVDGSLTLQRIIVRNSGGALEPADFGSNVFRLAV